MILAHVRFGLEFDITCPPPSPTPDEIISRNPVCLFKGKKPISSKMEQASFGKIGRYCNNYDNGTGERNMLINVLIRQTRLTGSANPH